MNANADIFAASLTQIGEQLARFIPGGRLIRKNGAIAMMTGLPMPTLNSVWLERVNPDVSAVAALLDEMSTAGLPYSLELRPGSSDELAGLAASRAMTRNGELPLMALGQNADSLAVRPPAELAIHKIAPDQASVHAHIAAAGFGSAEDVFLRMVGPDLLKLNAVNCYVGELNGQPVTTGVTVATGAVAGIFNIATVPGFRGRGFGTAITARAAADALSAGAAWCWLQSFAEGCELLPRWARLDSKHMFELV